MFLLERETYRIHTNTKMRHIRWKNIYKTYIHNITTYPSAEEMASKRRAICSVPLFNCVQRVAEPEFVLLCVCFGSLRYASL